MLIIKVQQHSLFDRNIFSKNHKILLQKLSTHKYRYFVQYVHNRKKNGKLKTYNFEKRQQS